MSSVTQRPSSNREKKKEKIPKTLQREKKSFCPFGILTCGQKCKYCYLFTDLHGLQKDKGRTLHMHVPQRITEVWAGLTTLLLCQSWHIKPGCGERVFYKERVIEWWRGGGREKTGWTMFPCVLPAESVMMWHCSCTIRPHPSSSSVHPSYRAGGAPPSIFARVSHHCLTGKRWNNLLELINCPIASDMKSYISNGCFGKYYNFLCFKHSKLYLKVFVEVYL